MHALWGDAARLAALPLSTDADALASARPVLSGRVPDERVLHLPPQPSITVAAASHAAAHWRFGSAPLPRAGLKPLQWALLGVLEDARVEWLALQELPGLRALWLPFHEGPQAARGNHFEALLARLARSLLDPLHTDPHPWVVKARAMFFARDGATLALRSLADVRQATSRLGHDIGQMRLPFNAPGYCVHAAYRDDNHWLWEPDPAVPPSGPPLEGSASSARAEPVESDAPSESPPQSAAPSSAGTVEATQLAGSAGTPTVYAEWDHRIRRYRSGWCQVFEREAPVADAAVATWPPPRRWAQAQAPHAAGRAAWGDDFHPAALVEARVQQRLRQPIDARVYRQALRPPAALAVLVLLDASASTADLQADGLPLLERLRHAAWACVAALEDAGHRSALMAFSSRGRQRVELQQLKHWHEAARAPAVAGRLQSLQPGGSTRLGAVLRHASAHMAAPSLTGLQPRVLLLTDGEPHDIDVHDPAYLRADLRRAVQESQRQGVAARCLLLGTASARVPAAMASSFGAGACLPLRRLQELPALLPQLMA
ncbi:VWA domain-containing protein [Xylophilus sp. GW821-FHT01B05]